MSRPFDGHLCHWKWAGTMVPLGDHWLTMDLKKPDIPDILLPGLRSAIQSLYLLFSLYIGFRFYQFYQWAMNGQGEAPTRPPSVEAFLPISALMGLKRLILTGKYDPVHPAGLTILIAIMVSALLFRKGFCGWVCPVGAISNRLEKLGRRINAAWRLPRWVDYPLLSAKYLLLGFFIYMIFWKMDLRQTEGFIMSPYNIAADAKMLQFFLSPTDTALAIIVALAALSVLIRNFWCRYLCPYGALLGLLAVAGPVQMRRDASHCTNCGSCERACPSSVRITSYAAIRSCECIGCSQCAAACPDGCITPAAILPLPNRPDRDGPNADGQEEGQRARRWIPASKLFIPTGTILILLCAWAVAEMAGLWESQVPPEVFSRMYKLVIGG